VVRQYRFLLRTAPLDALEAAHAEALPLLEAPVRASVLKAAQDHLVAGLRLGPDDTARLAHLVALGERRVPGAFIGACDARALQELAQAVIDTEAVWGLFGGYAGWDGAEPEPPVVVADMAGFDEAWHQALQPLPRYQGLAGPSAPDSWAGGGL
jgi:hypothetical protein